MNEWVQLKSTGDADFDYSGLKGPVFSSGSSRFQKRSNSAIALPKTAGMVLGARIPTLAGNPCSTTRLAARR
jgi:hypothetical protein